MGPSQRPRQSILATAPAGAPALVKPSLWQSVALGGSACVFTVNFTHPIEIVKTRMQVEGKFSPSVFLKEEGVAALWKGIQAGWLREASYTSVKLGGYGPIRKFIGADSPDAPFLLKFAAGSMSGGLGSVCGNPFDVMKTMMMADAKTKTPLPESAPMSWIPKLSPAIFPRSIPRLNLTAYGGSRSATEWP